MTAHKNISPKGCNDYTQMTKIIKPNPKGCDDYSTKIKTEKQSRRDDIFLSPLRGFGHRAYSFSIIFSSLRDLKCNGYEAR